MKEISHLEAVAYYSKCPHYQEKHETADRCKNGVCLLPPWKKNDRPRSCVFKDSADKIQFCSVFGFYFVKG